MRIRKKYFLKVIKIYEMRGWLIVVLYLSYFSHKDGRHVAESFRTAES